MARTYGCYVYGIDLSVNMILTALERAAAAGNGDKVGRQGGQQAQALHIAAASCATSTLQLPCDVW